MFYKISFENDKLILIFLGSENSPLEAITEYFYLIVRVTYPLLVQIVRTSPSTLVAWGSTNTHAFIILF